MSDSQDVQIVVNRQSIDILTPKEQILDYPRQVELAGRTCYKSEDKITEESASRFVRMLVKSRHLSVLEHCSISVRIVSDRAMTHQLVRHRIGAYSQESQRYCDYGKRGLQVILPDSMGEVPMGEYVKKQDGQWIGPDGNTAEFSPTVQGWMDAVANCYGVYQMLRENKIRPEDARSILPNATKTEIVATFNLRQWRHIFEERALNPRAQSTIREATYDILVEFAKLLPIMFADLLEKNKK